MNQYRVDCHVHTDASGDGRSTLPEQVAAAQRAGLHAIAVTDHNCCTHTPAALNGVLLIPGCEISTSCGHILGLFLTRDIPFPLSDSLPSGEEAVAAIREAGGLAVLAHPFQQPWREACDLPQDVDGVEVCNARGNLKRENANEMAAAFAMQCGRFVTGGSDAHHKNELGYAYTEITAEALTLDSLKAALLQHHSQAVLRQETSYTQKALSQWKSARKKSFSRRVRGVIYLLRGIGKDIFSRKSQKQKKRR